MSTRLKRSNVTLTHGRKSQGQERGRWTGADSTGSTLHRVVRKAVPAGKKKAKGGRGDPLRSREKKPRGSPVKTLTQGDSHRKALSSHTIRTVQRGHTTGQDPHERGNHTRYFTRERGGRARSKSTGKTGEKRARSSPQKERGSPHSSCGVRLTCSGNILPVSQDSREPANQRRAAQNREDRTHQRYQIREAAPPLSNESRKENLNLKKGPMNREKNWRKTVLELGRLGRQRQAL